jgi:hypothetical protein
VRSPCRVRQQLCTISSFMHADELSLRAARRMHSRTVPAAVPDMSREVWYRLHE